MRGRREAYICLLHPKPLELSSLSRPSTDESHHHRLPSQQTHKSADHTSPQTSAPVCYDKDTDTHSTSHPITKEGASINPQTRISFLVLSYIQNHTPTLRNPRFSREMIRGTKPTCILSHKPLQSKVFGPSSPPAKGAKKRSAPRQRCRPALSLPGA